MVTHATRPYRKRQKQAVDQHLLDLDQSADYLGTSRRFVEKEIERGRTRHGEARPGAARQARRGLTRLGWARAGLARQASLSLVSGGLARLARLGRTGMVWLVWASQRLANRVTAGREIRRSGNRIGGIPCGSCDTGSRMISRTGVLLRL